MAAQATHHTPETCRFLVDSPSVVARGGRKDGKVEPIGLFFYINGIYKEATIKITMDGTFTVTEARGCISFLSRV